MMSNDPGPPPPPIVRDPLPPPGPPVPPSVPTASSGEAEPSRGFSRVAVRLLMGCTLFLVALIGAVLLARLLRPEVAARQEAKRQGELSKQIAALKRADDRPERRKLFAAILAQGPEAVLKTLDATTPSDGRSSQIALPVIQVMAESGPEILPTLLAALDSQQVNRRIAAAAVLREMGQSAEPATDALARLTADATPWLRGMACDALGNIGPKAAPALKRLLDAVNSDDTFTRRHAVLAIGKLGPAAAGAIPILEKIQADSVKREVAEAADVALFQIDLAGRTALLMDRAIPEVKELVRKLESGDQFEAVAAAKALAAKGLQARFALGHLAKALAHPNKWVREAVANAIGTLGVEARPVVPYLERAAKDPEEEVRKAAEAALRTIGP